MPLWYVYSERVGVAIRLFSLAEEQLSTFMEGRCPRPSPLVGRLPMNAHVATRSTAKRNRSACSSRTGGWMGTLYWSRYGRLREHRTDRMVPGLRPGDGNRNLRCAVLTPQALRVDGPARGVPSTVNPLSRDRLLPPPSIWASNSLLLPFIAVYIATPSLPGDGRPLRFCEPDGSKNHA